LEGVSSLAFESKDVASEMNAKALVRSLDSASGYDPGGASAVSGVVVMEQGEHESQPVQGPQPASGRATRRTRILLVDDHAILRAGLGGLLREEPDLEVIGEAADGEAAVELAKATRPDVILMDVTMPRLNGIEATRQITGLLPQVRVIGLSMHDHDSMALAMRKAGASAYLSKDGRSEVLIATIRALSGPDGGEERGA
jgi:CheY-like chemotaxis protein